MEMTEIKIRPFVSKFTGKLYKDGILVGVFNCIEEWSDVRFQIMSFGLIEHYSFTFDFDETNTHYTMDEIGRWTKELPEYDAVTLNIAMGIREYQVTGVNVYKENY